MSLKRIGNGIRLSIVVFTLITTVTFADAEFNTWRGDVNSFSGAWGNPDFWSLGTVPTSTEAVKFVQYTSSDVNCVIDGEAAVMGEQSAIAWVIHEDANGILYEPNLVQLQILSGSLTVQGYELSIGFNPNTIGLLRIEEDGSFSGPDLVVYSGYYGNGTIWVNGGQFNCSAIAQGLGDYDGNLGVGTFILDAGDVNVGPPTATGGGNVILGHQNGGTGRLIVNGGLFQAGSIWGAWNLSWDGTPDCIGDITITGGKLHISDSNGGILAGMNPAADFKFDITGGELITPAMVMPSTACATSEITIRGGTASIGSFKTRDCWDSSVTDSADFTQSNIKFDIAGGILVVDGNVSDIPGITAYEGQGTLHYVYAAEVNTTSIYATLPEGGFVTIDDFESYDTDVNLIAVWDANASLSTTVKIDTKAMEVNGLKTVKCEPYQNWLGGGTEALSIMFHGIPTNSESATQMSVTITDGVHSSTIYYNGDANDIIQAEEAPWKQWDIDLAEFEDVNLVTVKSLAISLGGDVSDIVYFDDIRLYTPRCLADKVKADFNDDCFIDYEDLDVLLGGWLQNSSTLDLSGDIKVNLIDLAKMGEIWMQRALWPY